MGPAPINVAVLRGDPRLPYSFSDTGRFGDEELTAFRELESVLDSLEGYSFTYLDDHESLMDNLREARIDLALNFCDTGYRNDWRRVAHIPVLLEMLNIPYTGADPMALYVARDKSLLRALAASLDIPVPDEIVVDLPADASLLPSGYPALIKPNVGAGSFAMTEDCVVRDAREAEAYLKGLADKTDRAVVQEFLSGPEYTFGLIGNPSTGLTALRPAEIDYSRLDADLPPVFTYDAKFNASSRYWSQIVHRPAELDASVQARLVEFCTRMYRRLGLRDYARFDFRAGSDGRTRLLDVNPAPTWYADSRLAMMAKWTGFSYADMLQRILEAAVERYGLGPDSVIRGPTDIRNEGPARQ
jgi:D-alanine-D-alanine ligase